MRAISFIVAAITAAKVSAQEANEAQDNAYLLTGGYMGMGAPVYGEPYGYGAYGGVGGMVVSQPGFIGPQPSYVG